MENVIVPIHNNIQTEVKRPNTKLIKYIILVIAAISAISIGIITYRTYQGFKKANAIHELFVVNAYSDNEDIKAIIKRVKALPVKVQDVLINENIKIDYVPWLINKIPDYKDSWNYDVSGTFDGPKLRIVLYYEPSQGEGLRQKYNLSITTFHEIGHAYDFDYLLKRYGYAYSGTIEFDNIFKEEAPNFFKQSNFSYFPKEFREFYIECRDEYFAECFGYYYASEETNRFLHEQAPKTYDYIKKVSEPTEKYTFIKFLREKF